MLKNVFFVIIAVAAVSFAGFLFSSMTNLNKSDTNKAAAKKDPVTAVKSYAAQQFNVSGDKVKILSSTEYNWDDICMGMTIKDYDCVKTKTHGFEVALEIGGQKMRYRTNDDGSIIRFVKE